MAQLPPKIPNMTQNWPNFPHQRAPSMGNLVPNATQRPSWVEEFLDFSSAKRGSHRRSVSDSISFLEAPLVEESQSNTKPGNNEFDRLDDEQLMSMFSDDISMAAPPTASTSNPSSPSDHNSINDVKLVATDQPVRNESEVQSEIKQDPQVDVAPSTGGGEQIEQIVDPKRVKR